MHPFPLRVVVVMDDGRAAPSYASNASVGSNASGLDGSGRGRVTSLPDGEAKRWRDGVKNEL